MLLQGYLSKQEILHSDKLGASSAHEDELSAEESTFLGPEVLVFWVCFRGLRFHTGTFPSRCLGESKW